MWNPFKKAEPAAPVALAVAPPSGTCVVRPEKRDLIRDRIVVALGKLERRTDEPAMRKAAELKRSLRALDLEAEAAAIRSGVEIEIPAGSLTFKGD